MEVGLRHDAVAVQVHTAIDRAMSAIAVIDRGKQHPAIPLAEPSIVVEVTQKRIESDDERIVI